MTDSTSNTSSRVRKLVLVSIIAAMLTAVMIVIATHKAPAGTEVGVQHAASTFPAYAIAMAVLAIAYTAETLLRDPLRILASRIGIPGVGSSEKQS